MQLRHDKRLHSDHGDDITGEHTCHSRYTITTIKAACVHGHAMMPWEIAATVLNMEHASSQTACIYAKRSSVGFYNSMQVTDVVSSIVQALL